MAPDKKKEKKTKEDGPPIALSGVYVFANGDEYEGEYKQLEDGSIERHGMGSHRTKAGTIYTGLWENDKMNGYGKLIHPSGATYEGNFSNNQFHGSGRYIWPNGSSYEGPFCENRVEGEGQFHDTEGQVWTGIFRYKAAPGLRFKLRL